MKFIFPSCLLLFGLTLNWSTILHGHQKLIPRAVYDLQIQKLQLEVAKITNKIGPISDTVSTRDKYSVLLPEGEVVLQLPNTCYFEATMAAIKQILWKTYGAEAFSISRLYSLASLIDYRLAIPLKKRKSRFMEDIYISWPAILKGGTGIEGGGSAVVPVLDENGVLLTDKNDANSIFEESLDMLNLLLSVYRELGEYSEPPTDPIIVNQLIDKVHRLTDSYKQKALEQALKNETVLNFFQSRFSKPNPASASIFNFDLREHGVTFFRKYQWRNLTTSLFEGKFFKTKSPPEMVTEIVSQIKAGNPVIISYTGLWGLTKRDEKEESVYIRPEQTNEELKRLGIIRLNRYDYAHEALVVGLSSDEGGNVIGFRIQQDSGYNDIYDQENDGHEFMSIDYFKKSVTSIGVFATVPLGMNCKIALKK